MVEAFSGPVHLLGHSYGAILALEAAVSTNNLRTLTLFEPPIGWGELTPLLTRIDVLLDEGDREAATALIMREIAGLPDDALAELRTVPEAWQPMVACAHTFTREARSVAAFSLDAARYTNLSVPTVLLAGRRARPTSGSASGWFGRQSRARAW